MNGSKVSEDVRENPADIVVCTASKLRGWLSTRKAFAVQIVVFFLAVGVGWHFLAHWLWAGTPESIVDFLFLFATAVPLYFLTDRGLAAVQQKESNLRDSWERTTRIIEANPCGVVLVDREGRFEYANPEAAKILGAKRNDLVGLGCFDHPFEVTRVDGSRCPPEERPAWRALRRGEAVHDVELAVRRPDGARVVLSLSAVPIRDARGTIAGTILSFFDITDRKKAHDLDMRKLSLAIEQSPIAIMITDREGVVEYVNPSCARMTGYEAREVLGTRAVPCAGSVLRRFSQEAVRPGAGGEWRDVLEGRRRSGEPFWESVSISPIRNGDDAVSHFLWIREDITERRRSEEALKAKEEHFRQMFEQAEEPTIIFEPGSARIRDANPAAVRLFGYSGDELAEKGLALVADPEAACDLGNRIAAVDDDRKVALDAMTHIRKDGERIVVSIRGKSIRLLGGGRFTHCTFRDITDRVRLELESKSRQAQLIHANRMASLGTIVTGVAHEINNPNNLVMFNAPMVEAAWRDAARILDERRESRGDFQVGGLPYSEMRDVVPKLIGGMFDASQRIKAIVGNLKEFARRDPLDQANRFDVNVAVRTTVAILGHEIHKGCAEFRVETGELLPRVAGSSQQMEQVLVNLIMNALQALPDRKRAVRVSTSLAPGGRAVEIRVADEGRGMPPDVVPRLAEPFFTTRSAAGGLGLGLSISQSIVKAHGGALAFLSEVGRGTTAVVTLPAADDEAPRAAEPAASGGAG